MGAMELDRLALDLTQLADVAETLEHRIREGLAADGRSIKALPAHLAPPRGADGRALVVDAGGTNLRAAVVRVHGTEGTVEAGPATAELPVRGKGNGLTAAQFWQMQAERVASLAPPAGLPLGYCFSYPSTVHDDLDATLIRWTKGVDIEGVEGHRVGAPLAGALEARGLAPSRSVVLNDTVAALLGGALGAKRPDRVIGLICGTGTNMAAFFTPQMAPKLATSGVQGPMAVNLESGNFHPPHLSPIDDAFDAEGEAPGAQRFEKAVAGYALPYLFNRLVPDADLDPSLGTGPLVEIIRNRSGASAAAQALLDRSADLIAAGLWGVARTIGPAEPITVLAEGGLFWRADGYADRVRRTLAKLCGDPARFDIDRREDVNLVGTAVAALSADGAS